MIGHSLARFEDRDLLLGRGRFIDDINLPGQVHAAFVRSVHAHARVVSIEAGAARKQAGVLAVLTGAELEADGIGPLHERVNYPGRDGAAAVNPPRPALARDRVRHIGEAVAMVVADTRANALDAAGQVEVEYDALPAVVNVKAATELGAAMIWSDAPGNVALDWEGGDCEATRAAFAGAAHVTRLTLVNHRVVAAPIESRGVLASYDSGDGRFTIYTPTQGVNPIRDALAEQCLGVPPGDVRIITPDVGGAFGVKIPLYPEHVLVAWAARRMGRAVKWIPERSDAFVSDGQGRDHVMDAELALDAGGRFLAVRCHTLSNLGAYATPAVRSRVPTGGGTRCISNVYVIPAWHARVQLAFTNTIPIVAYRGAGKPEYIYVIERLVDAAARELEMDPAEIRRRNIVPPEAMPYDTGTGIEFDSGEFEQNMHDALVLADRHGLPARRAAAQARGHHYGFGLALFQEPDGFLDNRVSLSLDADAQATLTLTGQGAGHGHATTFAQVASHCLGLAVERIAVVQGDSDRVGPGRGTGGSRTATVASVGIIKAAETLVEKGRAVAADLFEASVEDIEFSDGVFRVVGTDRTIALEEIAHAAHDPKRRDAGGLDGACHYHADAYNYPCGCHVCEVEIDPDTGRVALQRYVAVNDHGVAINPMLLEGQVHGGVAQGIGQALLECCRYDEPSGQLITGSFMDYCMPRAADFPSFEFQRNVVPAKTNPLGIKGVGGNRLRSRPARGDQRGDRRAIRPRH